MRAPIALSVGLLGCLLGACFVDLVGEPKDDPSTTSSGVTTTTSSGASTTSSSMTTSSSSGSGGDGGGGGEQAECGDGVVELSEACEDGNDVDGDGCTGCAYDPASCGDDDFQAGETCAPGDPDCLDCQLTGGTCFGAAALPLGTTNLSLTAQSLAPFPNDCSVGGSTSQVFRFDTGPYPRGVLLILAESSVTQWPAVWASYGCGSQVVTPCDSSPGPLAGLATPLLAPGTTVFFGVADESDGGGAMTLVARPFRGLWSGQGLQAWDVAPGSWVYDGTFEELHDVDASVENKSRAFAPPVFVGGLETVTAFLHYGKTAGGALRLIASTDGGVTFAPIGMDLPDANFGTGGNAERTLMLNGATSVILGVELENPVAGGNQVWFNLAGVLEP